MFKAGRVFLLALVVTTVLASALGATVIISNDAEWQSPYLLGYYAWKTGYYFAGIDSPATAHDLIPYQIPKTDNVVIYEGPKPIVKNYEAYLRAQGFQHVTTVKFKSPYDLMYELPAKWHLRLTGAVLVSDAGGAWVLSAGPLAYASNSYLILLNNRTRDGAISFVKSHNLSPVYVIGYAGRSVKTELPNATIVATGNRAKDAVMVAELLRKYTDYDSVAAATGLYLYLPGYPQAPPWWIGGKGKFPILLVNVNGVPKPTLDFIENNFIPRVLAEGKRPYIVTIGPDSDAAHAVLKQEILKKYPNVLILEQFGIKVRGAPGTGGSQIRPLPVLFLPAADVSIALESANVLPDGRIFLKLRNLGNAAGYVMPTDVSIKCQGGFTAEITPDKAFFVDAKDATIVEYDLNKTVPLGPCTVHVEGVYGADKDRMELEFNGTVPVNVQGINDPSRLKVLRIVYSPRLEHIIVYVKNTGTVPTYATVYLDNLLVDGVPTTVKTRQGMVLPGETAKLYAKVYLTDADILDNPTVHYTARFGKDAGMPVHIVTGTLPLEKETLQDVVFEFVQENSVLVAAALVLIILILIVLRKR